MIDTQTPESPGWWLKRLSEKLATQREECEHLDVYYRGENVLPLNASKATREAYRRLMSMARTNYAELVVEAVRERVIPAGFMTAAPDDDLGDREAWRIWRANSLPADFSLVSRASLSMGKAYMIVGDVDPDIGAPLITPEDPREVVTERDSRRRRKTVAALKAYRDDVTGEDVAYLYLPGEVLRFARRPEGGVDHLQLSNPESWELDTVTRLDWPVVPVVPFINRADMAGRGKGEFATHLGLLDRISYGVLHRLEIATLQAFRQRAVKGVPLHDAHGNEIDYQDIFNADPGAMWHLPATAEMWESGQVDLGPLQTANRDDVQALAAVTRTPLFYLTPEATNGSAEGASLSREGLIFKATDRIADMGEPLGDVMQLAFLFEGDEVRSQRGGLEVMWEPPERYSLAGRADAAVKAAAGGMPWREIMLSIWQFSPSKVDQLEAQRASDLFSLALMADATDEPVA